MEEFMFCRRCGKKIVNDSYYCQYCGTKVVYAEDEEFDAIVFITPEEATNGCIKIVELANLYEPLKINIPPLTKMNPPITDSVLMRLRGVKFRVWKSATQERDVILKIQIDHERPVFKQGKFTQEKPDNV